MKKVLFLCGSLEAGKDGVGDYTRILAEELLTLNVSVTLLALSDRHSPRPITHVVEKGIHSYVVRRLPAGLVFEHQVDELEKICSSFVPDFISLQFVPFSFHSKGLIWELDQLFRKVNISRFKLGVTFHELWVDTRTASSFKLKVLGYVQKFLIQKFLKQFTSPTIITTNEGYASRLQEPQVHILPLLGNITIAPITETVCEQNSGQFLEVLLFGNLTEHLNDFQQQLKFLGRLLTSGPHQEIRFNFAGRQGPSLGMYQDLVKKVLPMAHVLEHGPLPERELSYLMQSMDVAISRANGDFFNKSGSTIAILEHGVPVVLRGRRQPLVFADESWSELTHFAEDPGVPKLEKGASRSVRKLVAEKFLTIIQTA